MVIFESSIAITYFLFLILHNRVFCMLVHRLYPPDRCYDWRLHFRTWWEQKTWCSMGKRDDWDCKESSVGAHRQPKYGNKTTGYDGLQQIDNSKNQYILSIKPTVHELSIVWLEASIGEFQGNQSWPFAIAFVINPSEIIVPENTKDSLESLPINVLESLKCLMTKIVVSELPRFLFWCLTWVKFG